MKDLGAISVLIVDPAGHTSPLLRALLVSLGVRKIESERTIDAALLALRLHRYGVIFFDESGGNQINFVNSVRRDVHSRNGMIPVILVAAGLQQAQITDARIAGMHDVIVKPVSAATLEKKLHALLLVMQNSDESDWKI